MAKELVVEISSADGQIKSSAHHESSDTDSVHLVLTVENVESLETAPVPNRVSAPRWGDDSTGESLDSNEQDAGLVGSSDSSFECDNATIKSAQCPSPSEESVETEESLSEADGISSPALDDSKLVSEPEVVKDVKEPALEVEFDDFVETSYAYAEEATEAQDGSAVALDISASHWTTKLVGTGICFGTIGHEELSLISIKGRTFYDKCVVNVGAARQASPDLKSPEGDDSDWSTSRCPEVVNAAPQTDEVSPSEGSIVVLMEVKPVVAKVETRLFNYWVRFPRHDDKDLSERIDTAVADVSEKTRCRDAIQGEIRMMQAICEELEATLRVASSEARFAVETLKSKSQEIESVQYDASKLKDAMSIYDINDRIHSINHRIIHETLHLKEERQLVREIEKLKKSHEHLSAKLGRLDELEEVLNQKDEKDECLKILREEEEVLKGNAERAQGVRNAAKENCEDKWGKITKLQDRHKAATSDREKAYSQLLSLRKQLGEKNKYFYKNKDDKRILSDLRFKGNRNGLSQFCIKQVEDFMDLWNNNAEFRSEYIRCSSSHTVRRLGTKDGRSLGVGEQPPPIPPYRSKRLDKNKSMEKANARVAPLEVVGIVDDESEKPVEEKKPSEAGKKISAEVVSASSDSVRDVEVAKVVEEPKMSEEDVENARKEEEEEEKRLKEQLRLEEKVKAEAAREKKNRLAEKAQARAEAKVKEEAEQKEKKRLKRLKKKERKKAAAGSAPAGASIEGEPSPPSQTPLDTPKEPETTEKVETAAKKIHRKPTHFTKQTKLVKPITVPPPLRNRRKRKMQSWMWVLLIAVVILALFWVGNARQLF